jgi:hypothetical protein
VHEPAKIKMNLVWYNRIFFEIISDTIIRRAGKWGKGDCVFFLYILLVISRFLIVLDDEGRKEAS